MPKRKTKMLSIRISEDEYESLKSTYNSSGTRSVSALARDALQRIIRGSDGSAPANVSEGPRASVEIAVRALDRKLGVLQDEVSRLSRTVAASLPEKIKD